MYRLSVTGKNNRKNNRDGDRTLLDVTGQSAAWGLNSR